MIGYIVTCTGTRVEPALRSDGVENRLLHFDLGDPRMVATRRAAIARRALLNLRGSPVPEPVLPLSHVTSPTVAPLERRLSAPAAARIEPDWMTASAATCSVREARSSGVGP
jgi:hypothetical protein